MHVEEPWGAEERPSRLYVTASTVPLRRHENWAIVQIEPRPPGNEIDELLDQAVQHIGQVHHWDVASFAESAVGIGMVRMPDYLTREMLVAVPPVPFGNGRLLSFARHDEGENFRATTYTRVGWIMLLNLHMDYRNDEFLRETVGKFGKMKTWLRDDPSPSRTLVRCAYGGARDIPRSIVIREPQRHGGVVVSWTVPVFILNSEPADILPGDEDPEPLDGNPHPLPGQGPVLHVNDANEDWQPANVEQDMPGWGNWAAEAAGDNDHQQQDNEQQSSITIQLSGGSVDSINLQQAGAGPGADFAVQGVLPIIAENLQEAQNIIAPALQIAEENNQLAIIQGNADDPVHQDVQIFRVLLPDPVAAWTSCFAGRMHNLLFSSVPKSLPDAAQLEWFHKMLLSVSQSKSQAPFVVTMT